MPRRRTTPYRRRDALTRSLDRMHLGLPLDPSQATTVAAAVMRGDLDAEVDRWQREQWARLRAEPISDPQLPEDDLQDDDGLYDTPDQ